jgi:hypothetical protein
MKIIKKIIWRWKIQRKFNKIYEVYINNSDIFHPKEQESIRTIKNLFNFFLNRNSWERNKDKIENQVEKLNIKINYRIKNTKWKF